MRLIYLSPVPWASFSQRPHHFVHWYHDLTGEPVLWIDPYPTRLPALDDFRRKQPMAAPPDFSIPSWLHLCQPPALPIEPLPGASLILKPLWRRTFRTVAQFCAEGPCRICVGKPSELALQVLARLPDSPAIYDAMDDFPAFYQGLSRRSMARRQAQLIQRVPHLLVSSTALHDRHRGMAERVELALNACDLQQLAPVEGLDLGRKQQVLGYVGTMGHWFDWDLVIALARANPTHPVRLIGPVFTPPPGALPANIELTPECAHAEAIAAMARFSVGLIPFKRNPLTASVDPIKYYEYRALGLPVIATRFGEMALRSQAPGVWLVDGDSDLRQTALQALACPGDPATIRQFRQDNLWANRFAATRVLGPLRGQRG
ncbi:glycosyl transferase [Pseudomonas citrulli]|uniref:Glycosyl transferase n=1 Tax=Pseudomonas citrulli TaxID=3064347 RepID=A0ABT9C1L1_9PSED|nr:glycosyl transferase [Pseudomonas sp. K18]MDO7898346.1 glycosyl transferase [Pseudomonas sp. K18]